MNEQPKVLLCALLVRKSERTGKSYLSGWLGKSRLIGFQGEPDKFGNPTFDVFLQVVEERREERADRREPWPSRENHDGRRLRQPRPTSLLATRSAAEAVRA